MTTIFDVQKSQSKLANRQAAQGAAEWGQDQAGLNPRAPQKTSKPMPSRERKYSIKPSIEAENQAALASRVEKTG